MLTPFGYFNLIEAFQKPGCAVCGLLLHDADQLLDSLLYENSTDPQVQNRFRDSRGLCNEHASRLIRPGRALNIAVLYEGVVHEVLTLMNQAGGGGQPNGLMRRLFSGGSSSIADALTPSQRCIACEAQDINEKQYLEVLNQYLNDAKLLAAYQASDGLCLEHFRRALKVSSAASAQTLIDTQTAIWSHLRDELNEFMRKYDFNNADEKMGAEADSWQRAIVNIAGLRGVFGLMDED